MRIARTAALASLSLLLGALLTAGTVAAAGWNPAAYTGEETIEIRTIGPEEGEYWFPVWIVVLDGQAYVRLGSRAAERMQKNTTGSEIAVKIAGQHFDRIRTEEAPDQAERVSKAMAEKYWSDVFVRFFSHPLTLRLVPADGASGT